MKKTDLDSVKSVAISMLYLDVEETEFSPIVVQHPIFENGFLYNPKTNTIFNMFENTEEFNEVLKCFEEKIQNEKTLVGVYNLIRTSYKMTFFKFVNKYLSEKDYAEILADAWTTSENPNQDVNVSLKQAERMFKKADKKYLMTKSEYDIYESLPETFEVYRGVAIGRNPDGMSWTRDKEKAEWFSNRFNIGEDAGYIQAAIANKKDVLAYFNSRDEEELVISKESLNGIYIV